MTTRTPARCTPARRGSLFVYAFPSQVWQPFRREPGVVLVNLTGLRSVRRRCGGPTCARSVIAHFFSSLHLRPPVDRRSAHRWVRASRRAVGGEDVVGPHPACDGSTRQGPTSWVSLPCAH